MTKLETKELILRGKEAEVFFKNYFYEPLAEDQKSLGKFFLLLEVLNASQIQGREIGKKIHDKVKEVFFVVDGRDPYERFEEALKQANEVINSIHTKSKRDFRINGIIAVLVEGELHLSQTGYAEAYLARRNIFTLISEGLFAQENDKEAFQNIASGVLEDGDRLVFSSERLLRFANQSELAKIFGMEQDESVMTEVRDMINLEGVENVNIAMHTITGLPLTMHQEEVAPSTPITQRIQGWISTLELKGISRNTLLGVVGLVLVVLVVSVFLLGSNRQSQVNQELAEKTIKQIQVDIDNANRLALIGKKSEAGEILNRAEDNLDTLVTQNPYNYRETLDALKERIAEQRDSTDAISRLDKGNVLADLSGVSSKYTARGMATTADDRKFVYDQNTITETILSEVQSPVTVDKDVEILDGTSMDEYDAVVLLTKKSGLVEYQDGSFTFADTADEDWKPGLALAAYSKYIYVIDPTADQRGQIWKYERTRSGYKSASAYNIDADLSTAVDLAIDGNVWVLTSDGMIIKLFKGEVQDLTIKDSPSQALDNPTKIFTVPDMKNLYVLDPKNHRVLAYFKDTSNPKQITYVQQYIYSDKLEAKDIFVDKSEQKLYLLTTDKIMEYGISSH